MNILNDMFKIGGGKSSSLTADPSTDEISLKTAYQARHLGRFCSFPLERTEAAEMACLFVVPENEEGRDAA